VIKRDIALGLLPHALVEGVRDRRMLERLGAATTRPPAAALVRSAHLDLLPPGALSSLRTVVDVGANVGAWTRAVLTVARPKRLIAVEPAPQARRLLLAATANHPEVQIVEIAVGAATGEATFRVTADSHNASLLVPRTDEMDAFYGGGYAVVEELRVPVAPLDDITAELDTVDLLKIDVQGAERDVLAGGPETLAKTRLLMIEANLRSHYEGDLLLPDLHALLVDAGFALAGLSPPRVENGVALWCDALYAR
jgi:FkbM family methyltransferase